MKNRIIALELQYIITALEYFKDIFNTLMALMLHSYDYQEYIRET